jgi:alpha-2-macroglobulin
MKTPWVMKSFRFKQKIAVVLAGFLCTVTGLGISAPSAWGFEPARTEVRADRDRPQICVHFDEALPTRGTQEVSDYLKVTPSGDLAISTSGKSLCIGGVRHGARYQVEVLAGLKSISGGVLAKNIVTEVTVADRTPRLRLPGAAYVLPTVGSRGVAVKTVNVDTVDLNLYRVHDRGLVNQLNLRRMSGDPGWHGRSQIENQDGERVWNGSMAVVGARNREITTLFPIDEALKERTPGIYLLVARVKDSIQSQWIVASDIGLTTFNGRKGMAVVARSLATARPIEGVRLELLAKNNSILAAATTDASGMAHFEAGYLRGAGGQQAVTVTASRSATILAAEQPTPIGQKPIEAVDDFNFIDLTGPAFDLADRGVEGRLYPGPVDGFIYLDRGIYRPGERVRAVALIRDDKGDAIADLPITFRLYRPDGSEARRIVKVAGPAGAIDLPLDFAQTDATGRWSLAAHVDPRKPSIADTSFQIADFVPPKVALELEPVRAFITAGQDPEVTAKAEFFYGAPASALRGEFAVSWERRAVPFKKFHRYAFGLEKAPWEPIHQKGDLTKTDEKGHTRLRFTPPLAGSTLPLEARLRVTVFEDGGRPVNRRLSLPYHRATPMLGIQAGFDDRRVAWGEPARLNIIAVDPTSEKQVALEGARWELFEEEHDYFWYRQNGQWKWRTTITDRSIDSGELTLVAGAPMAMSFKHDWGRFRLEVFDPTSGEASSLRYAVGWSSSPSSGAEIAPDKLEVTLDAESYQIGDVAIVRINPPFDGEVMLSVLGDKVEHTIQVQARRGGTQVRLPVADWGVGAYVVATAFRPAPAEGRRGPARAIGLAWLSLDQSARHLDVTIDAPDVVKPHQSIDIAVSVTRSDQSDFRPKTAFVTLAAVDDAVLGLTDFVTPDPSAYFLAKRRMGVDIRDIHGRLLDGRGGETGVLRSGGGAAARHLGGLSARSSKVVALFSGVVPLDANGKARIPLDLPDFNGRLRLMAIAFDQTATGSKAVKMTVRDPVVAELALPRFLAPGDEAEATLSVDMPGGNLTGKIRVTLSTEGSVTLAKPLVVELEAGQDGRFRQGVTLLAGEPGVTKLVLSVKGPAGLDFNRSWNLAVRSAEPFSSRKFRRKLAPGGRLLASEDLLDDYYPGDATAAISIDDGLSLDIDALITDLARYPYGCLEQTVSKNLPLLAFTNRGAARSKDGAVDVPARLSGAIRRVLSMQRSDGAFGLWSFAGKPEYWLSAYAVDFLVRAKEAGHEVDTFALNKALGWLDRSTRLQTNASDWRREAAAYAFYVLSKTAASNLGNLRYFADNNAQRISNPLALAQLAAALARYGEKERADTLTRSAIMAALSLPVEPTEWSADYYHTYGSPLRDGAATLALTVRAGAAQTTMAPLVDRVAEIWADTRYASTQGKAWMLLAGEALADRDKEASIEVDGVVKTAALPFAVTADLTRLRQGLELVNRGTEPLTYALTTSGYPSHAQSAASDGYAVERSFLSMTGDPIDPRKSKRGDLVVVVAEGKLTDTNKRDRRTLMVQLLPAGFEIETADFGGGVDVARAKAIGELTKLTHRELRDDRYVAQFDVNPAAPTFRAAFVMRAVTPGRFTLPGIRIEDMYEPAIHARTEAMSVTVSPVDR